MKTNSGRRCSFFKAHKNQKGQMAIFIALIFQVLFVLFAMSINVALVVHDKINLQNSVDLAAYYAAQRQAEHLNVMAHMNYQIRQAWKLLTFRYRVIGTLGIQSPQQHPQFSNNIQEAPFLGEGVPVFCANHDRGWSEAPDNQNQCKTASQNVPALTIPPVIAGFNPINQIIREATEELQRRAAAGCDEIIASSFWYGATVMKSFREDIANRKEVIETLALNMQRPGDQIVDLDGSPILVGVRQVINKNLTHGNRDLGDATVQYFNSLEGLNTQDWLSHIRIDPVAYYANAEAGGGNGLGGCNTTPQPFLANELPSRGNTSALMNNLTNGSTSTSELSIYASGAELGGNPLYNYSLGYEKNPWRMVYSAVRAETRARQLFFPLGQSLRLRARAYAKPFGGRFGPWYGNTWPSGANQSSTGAQNTQTDPLAPLRRNANEFNGDPTRPDGRIPNFSRFPGDRFGLDSQVAQASIVGLKIKDSMSLEHYKFTANPVRPGAPNISLAHSRVGGNLSRVANTSHELAAISPNLFDITYYSIDPNFNAVYLSKLQRPQVRQALDIPDSLVVRGDYGSDLPDGQNSPPENISSTIARTTQGSGTNATYHPLVNYKVNDRKNLLTSWIPDGVSAFIYTGQNRPDHFGECAVWDDAGGGGTYTLRVPGSCLLNGGRTGYSVKMISRDSVLNGEYTFGPGAVGPIENNQVPDGF